ncbi:adenylate/guanylate cyclase domain-containing protein [Paraconexibacter sp.]|uniref:adenylate/guanylate cyclase domain-containing protein n=1 Tax=Paraconexibacter sp. TaxID=2949640 RepID=UPI0035648886
MPENDERDPSPESAAAPREQAAPAARSVAVVRRIDSQPLLLRLASGLRRRLPGDDRFGDPLSVAGSAPAEVVGRQVQVLSPERPSVAREIGLGALQVWQALSESAGRGRGDREVTMLFTDLVGFSAWALRAGDEAAVRLLREVGIIVEGAVAEHRGTLVKRMGDGLMAVFLDPESAVRAALDASDRLATVEVEGYTPRMRAGAHVGRPRHLGGDYLGVDVNIAARVADQAGAGEVLVSAATLAHLEADAYRVGRAKRLKASGAPKDLRVHTIRRSS